MPAQSDSPAFPGDRTALMLEAARLLVDELALLAKQDWEALPDLKKKKVVAASRLRRLRAEIGAADGAPSPAIETLIAESRKPEGGLVTISLAADFVGVGKLGQWIAFDTRYVKTGRSLCFAQAFVTADDEVIARADARFKLA